MRIGYARALKNGANLKSQLKTLHAAGCNQVFSEALSSNAVEKPQLSNALGMLGAGDQLVVTNLATLARSVHDLLEVLVEIEGKGAFFSALEDGLDTQQATGGILDTVRAIDQMLQAAPRERMQARVLEQISNPGRGRPRALTDEQIRKGRALRKKGYTYDAIAGQLQVSVGTLYNAIKQ